MKRSKNDFFYPIEVEKEALKSLGYVKQDYTWGGRVYGWYFNEKLCREEDAINALTKWWAKQDHTLRIFVWEDFYPDSAGSMAVIIAHNEREAHDLLAKKDYAPSFNKAKIYPLKHGFVAFTSGGC